MVSERAAKMVGMMADCWVEMKVVQRVFWKVGLRVVR